MSKRKKTFATMKEADVRSMSIICENALWGYMNDGGFGNLRNHDRFDIPAAINRAILAEWEKAKQAALKP